VADEIEVRLADVEQDPQIAEAILQSFSWHTDVPDSVQAEVREGWVTLRGEVESDYQRYEAERAVANARGVTGISNKIAVSPKMDSADVKERVSDALRRNSELDADKIWVTTEDSKVTLHGHVHSIHERNAAEKAAWAPGVSHVQNKISVER
jgi:osmotically-inducible protein OsmY